jgi:hypothetical protein
MAIAPWRSRYKSRQRAMSDDGRREMSTLAHVVVELAVGLARHRLVGEALDPERNLRS